MLTKNLCTRLLTSNHCCNIFSVGKASILRPSGNYFYSYKTIDLKASTMSSGADLDRIKARAVETEAILSNLQNQIDAIRKAAVKQASLSEEEKLIKENEALKKEIESLKMSLILAEVGNGVRQIRVPTKEVASAMSGPAVKVENGPSSSNQSKPETVPAKVKEENVTPLKKAKTEKKGKGEGASDKTKTGGGEEGKGEVDISRLCMRVGKIVGVEKHPDADSLYVEQVDLGEGKNRTIVSGLVKHVPINAMKDRVAVFMCNLKPAKMRGVLSEGMIMCASSPEKTEILVPPTNAVVGDRVIVKDYPGEPDAQLNPKKKIWETLKPDVRTNKDRVATYKGAVFTIEGKGVVEAPTLADAQIS